MWPSVSTDIFMRFSEQFEGAVDYMFLDNKNRVGTAYGIDLDWNGNGESPSVDVARRDGLERKALQLRWVYRDTNNTATPADVRKDWETVKSMPGHYFPFYKAYTKLQLPKDAMIAGVTASLRSNEWVLKQNSAFRNFDKWPADAQLAVMGLSWNGPGRLLGNGPNATLPNPTAFRAACEAEDFGEAASHCQMTNAIRGDNNSIYRRSQAQMHLLLNADIIVREEARGSYQRSLLYWPTWLDRHLIATPPHPHFIR